MKNDNEWTNVAIALAKKCTPSKTAFCVGAIIIDSSGNKISSGYSRETSRHKHAEEIAIEKALLEGSNLKGATLYSSLEPCGERLSGRKTCTELIISSGIKRVVFAAYEPSTFVEGKGEELLNNAGIETIFLEIRNQISVQ